MDMEEEDGGGKVMALINKAINSTAAEVDPRLLKAIKSVVRHSDSELRLAAHALMDLMKRDHSQVRYLALLIIDELFMRSKLFRTIIVENLDQMLSLSVGFRRNLPLPAPPAVASVLRSKAIEFLEKWNGSFGIHYRQIRLGFDYLKNTLRLQFPNIQANAARLQQERREREMKSKEILTNKFETLKKNMSSIKQEMQSTIEEIGECLKIVGTKAETVALGPLDEEDFEDFRSKELQQIRLDSLREAAKVHENNENKVVFDTLRELYKLLVSKHLACVQEWISVLVKVETTDNRLRDSMLKEFIDLRNCIQSVKKQCVESGFALPDTTSKGTEEEEDFWEEGKIESIETRNSRTAIKSHKNFTVASSSGAVKNKDPEFANEKLTLSTEHGRSGSKLDSLRSKLLADAPLIQWGPFLDNWGSKGEVLLNQRGLELENHWGRVDYDAVIPSEKIAELNIRATLYQEEQAEIQPCHAPLRNGGLCQRRDLRVCPFHGPIVPRDDRGNPIKNSTPNNETAPDLGSDLVEQLAKQAVKNVRERDFEEARERKMDKAAQKRAKLAKIREHNEAVLKDAALASTSNSAYIGEDEEATGGQRSMDRNKRETLSSMLCKKVTTKDRLAQRLLNARLSNSTTRQLTLDEDAKYREAFLNQW